MGCIAKGAGAVFMLFAFLVLITSLNQGRNHTAQSAKPEQAEPVDARQPTPDPFVQMTSTEHLAKAKEALSTSDKPHEDTTKASWGMVDDARKHLEAIRPDAAEYAESRNLLEEVGRRDEAIKTAAKMISAKHLAELREQAAQKYEERFLAQGIDAHLSVSGEDNTQITIRYVLFTRPLIYKITRETRVIHDFSKMGFKQIAFTDGYDHSWTFDCEKNDWVR